MFKQVCLLSVVMMGCAIQTQTPQHYDLYIDDGFSIQQTQAIIDAAMSYQTKNEGMITFSGTSWQDGPETIQVLSVPVQPTAMIYYLPLSSSDGELGDMMQDKLEHTLGHK